MSGSKEFAQHFCDILAPLGNVEVRPFFGGWGLALRGVQFAMVMDTLYFYVDDAAREAYAARGSVPFTYNSGARRVRVARYASVPESALEDEEELNALAQAAVTASRRAATSRGPPLRVVKRSAVPNRRAVSRPTGRS